MFGRWRKWYAIENLQSALKPCNTNNSFATVQHLPCIGWYFQKPFHPLLHSYASLYVIQKFYFVIFLSVQYAVHLFRYLKEWRKNPQWSFTCCLALFLPLSDFQGAISGLEKTVGQTEEIEMPSIIAVVKKCGTVDAPLEADTKDDNKAMKMQDDNCLSYDNTKCHQGTQTDPFTSLTAHVSINTCF